MMIKRSYCIFCGKTKIPQGPPNIWIALNEGITLHSVCDHCINFHSLGEAVLKIRLVGTGQIAHALKGQ